MLLFSLFLPLMIITHYYFFIGREVTQKSLRWQWRRQICKRFQTDLQTVSDKFEKNSDKFANAVADF